MNNDTTFAVKSSLIVDFDPVQGDSQAKWELVYDFKVASLEDAGKFSMAASNAA